MEDEVYNDLDLERRVLSHHLRFDNTLAISPDFFTMKESIELFGFVTRNRGIYDDMDAFWKVWRVNLKLKNQEKPTYRKFLEHMYIEDRIPDELVDYHLQEIRSFAELRQLLGVYKESISKANDGNPKGAIDELEEGLAKLRANFSDSVISRCSFFDEHADRLTEFKQKRAGEKVTRIPTGIKRLDEFITGVPPMSLNLFQGETNIGKTFFLQEVAYQAYLRGLNVLFVTIELSAKIIETRWDARISGIDYDKIDLGKLTRKEEKLWKDRIDETNAKSDGAIKISFIPEGCTIGSLETELDYWKNSGFQTDVICIDYMDLMKTRRRSDSEQENQGGIARDLKRLSQTRDLVVWTATQTAGRSYGKDKLGLEDVGFSKKKAMWANLMLGLGADEDSKDDGVINLTVIKNSFGGKGYSIYLETDFSKGIIDTLNVDDVESTE